MSIFYCAFCECIRKPVKSLIILLLFILILTSEMIGLVLSSTARYAQNDVLRQIGAVLSLYTNPSYSEEQSSTEITQEFSDDGFIMEWGSVQDSVSAVFPQELSDDISAIEHVAVVNQLYAGFAQPMEFLNCKESTGVDPHTQQITENMENWTVHKDGISIEGATDISYIDEFRTGLSKLIDGSMPSAQNPGAIVEERLAKLNQFQIGDEITVASDFYDVSDDFENTVRTMKIVGIYSTGAKFEVAKDNGIGEHIYAYSPYNTIFTDLNSALSLFDFIKKDELIFTIYLDSPSYLDEVGQKIKMLDIDWDQYALDNETEFRYQWEAKQIDTLVNYANLILLYVTLCGAILLTLILSIWSKGFLYESAVLLALGASRRRALGQFLITTAYIMGIAIGISLILSNALASAVADNMIQNTTMGMMGVPSFLDGKEIDTAIHIIQPNHTTYLVFIGIVFGFLMLSCLIPMYQLIRVKTRKLLSSH